MSIAEVLKQTKRRLDALPPNKVRTAAEFIEFLAAQSSESLSMLKRPPFEQRLKRAERQAAEGRLTSAAKLKRKY